MTVAECYRILELEPGSSKDEISKAYRRLALQYHPDCNPGEQSAINFIRITEAYQLLIRTKSQQLNNPSGRNDYYHHQAYSQSKTEDAREKAKAWARMRYEEAVRKSEELEKTSIHGFLWPKSWNYFFLILAMLTILDSFLPPVKKVFTDEPRELIGIPVAEIKISGHVLPLEFFVKENVLLYSPLVVVRTPLFSRLHYFYFEDDKRIQSPISAFPNLVIIPILVFIMSLGVLYLKINSLEYKIMLKFGMLIMLIVFAIAWIVAP